MAKTKKEKKIFVLDTSVILFAHNAITSFAEHDVAIPITVLEELDNFKKGNDTKNFEAREFIRQLDELSANHTLNDWIPLNGKEKGKFKVLMETQVLLEEISKSFLDLKADHKILNAALCLKKQEPTKKVVLITKDINLRLKAKSFDLDAQDYETGKIKNINTLQTGKNSLENVDSAVINKLYDEGECSAEEILEDQLPQHNGYYILKSNRNSALAYFNPTINMFQRVDKRSAYGITPRNAEQTFALHAIMQPEIKLITIQGVAGTGKTLLALAGALEKRREFKQIYLARPIVPLSNKDIGYLPGDIQSKINPYMDPLWDNLKFIQNQFEETDREHIRLTEMVEKQKLLITPLAYIRGRSLSNICFIVDEAQNLTPHEIKTIITRAGENTKIIFTGDIYQIDTPYLDTKSNGLSYLIDRIRDHTLYAQVTLEKGERSELANLANDLL